MSTAAQLVKLRDRLARDYRHAVLTEAADEQRLYLELESVRRQLQNLQVTAHNDAIAGELL